MKLTKIRVLLAIGVLAASLAITNACYVKKCTVCEPGGLVGQGPPDFCGNQQGYYMAGAAFAPDVASIGCSPKAYTGITGAIMTNNVPAYQYVVVGTTPAGACYLEYTFIGCITVYCKGVTTAGEKCPCGE